MSENAAKLNIFISYSRRDMEFADQLVEALESKGFAVKIDRRDLPYGEEWQAELANLNPFAETAVNVRRNNRAPLLMIGASQDRLTPPSMVRANVLLTDAFG